MSDDWGGDWSVMLLKKLLVSFFLYHVGIIDCDGCIVPSLCQAESIY